MIIIEFFLELFKFIFILKINTSVIFDITNNIYLIFRKFLYN